MIQNQNINNKIKQELGPIFYEAFILNSDGISGNQFLKEKLTLYQITELYILINSKFNFINE